VLRWRRLTDACLNKHLLPLVEYILLPSSPRLVFTVGASLHAFSGAVAEIAITLYTDRVILRAV
jgi:hypothetical protein